MTRQGSSGYLTDTCGAAGQTFVRECIRFVSDGFAQNGRESHFALTVFIEKCRI